MKNYLTCLLLLISTISFSQKYQNIELKTLENKVYIGKILNSENDSILFKITKRYKIKLANSEIQSVDTVNILFYNFDNKFGNNYFITNSAIPLKKKDFYFTSNEIFLQNGVEYGLTNYISVGGGLSYYSSYAFSKIGFSMFKIVHVNVQSFTFALGFLVPFTYVSSNITIGNQNNNLSVGYGFLFMVEEKLQQSALKISANLRFNKNIYLLTENYLICNLAVNVKYSFSGCTGFRYVIKNNSFKLGVFYSQEFPFVFPVVGYSRYLYKKSKF